MIGCGELMQYVTLACARGPLWRGRNNWVPTDNMNTFGWIRDRYSTVPEIQFLLRVLTNLAFLPSAVLAYRTGLTHELVVGSAAAGFLPRVQAAGAIIFGRIIQILNSRNPTGDCYLFVFVEVV